MDIPGLEPQLQIPMKGRRIQSLPAFLVREFPRISQRRVLLLKVGGGNGKGGGKDKNQPTNPYQMKSKDGESKVMTFLQ